jgi:hypothetical protein
MCGEFGEACIRCPFLRVDPVPASRLAGVRLVAELRTLDPAIPIAICRGTRTMQALGDRALVAGASAVTDSPHVVSEPLHCCEPWP